MDLFDDVTTAAELQKACIACAARYLSEARRMSATGLMSEIGHCDRIAREHLYADHVAVLNRLHRSNPGGLAAMETANCTTQPAFVEAVCRVYPKP